MSPDKIARIAEEVVRELRDLGLAPGGLPARAGGASYGTTATGGPGATAATIRPYGAGAPAGAPREVRSASPSPAFASPVASASGALRPEDLGVSPEGRPTCTVNVSNRHIHLTKADFETLFGPGAEPTPRNMLMQPGQYAAEQSVTLLAGRGRGIEHVRILGPLRKYTQIEISRTDAFYLGIAPPVRGSGDVKGSAGGTLVGPKGTLVLKEGIIVADRHIHTPPDVAKRFGLADNQMIRVRVFQGEKPTTMEMVRIRVLDEFLLEMHVDTDDANASGIRNGDRVEMVM